MLVQDQTKRQYDMSIDWWALGILLYEMLVGQSPFYDKNPFKVKEKIRNQYRTADWPT